MSICPLCYPVKAEHGSTACVPACKQFMLLLITTVDGLALALHKVTGMQEVQGVSLQHKWFSAGFVL